MNLLLRRFRVHFVVALCILVFAFSPFVPVVIAAAVANMAGCSLNEGTVTACPIAGIDWGRILNELGALGWLGLATFPFAGLLSVCWIVWVVVTLIKLRN
jgi:hypothetical protein